MNLKKIVALLLCIALVCITAVCVFGEEPPEGFATWEEYYDFLIYGETGSEEMPELHDMNKVAENDRFTMYYYENGADVFLEEKSTGKVWGSAIDGEYVDVSAMSTEQFSNLLSVSYADKESNLTEVSMTDAENDDFSSSVSYDDNKVILSVSVTAAEIDFTVEIVLNDGGMEVNIPFDSIKENGEYTLVSIKLIPAFGAAKPGEDGYIFYPDGSGALINIADYEMSEPAFYQYTYYCDDKKDFLDFDDRKTQDIKNLVMPVFGIKHTKGGVFADIVSGDENAKLHIEIDKTYRTYFEFVYRTYETVVYEYSKDTQGVNKVGNVLMKGDRTARYNILTENKNTYSDMAVTYRESLIESGKLTKKAENTGVPLSVEFFMGISKSGILGDSVQTLTSFKDAEKIASDLYGSGIKNLDIRLLGWAEGGYSTLPTAIKAEGKFGGQSGLNSLAKLIKSKGGNTYLFSDFINANIKTGDFNSQKHTLRDGLDSPVTDKEEIRYWLNPVTYMSSALKKLQKAQKKDTSICFGDVGSWLLSDSGESRPITRAEIVKAEQNALKSAAKSDGAVAVSGGNKYVLSAANRLYDIPDNDSGYFQNDVTVPFYQMVVHSFVDYSSLAANMSYDYNRQKLRFVETGSIPHFIITEESPNLLQGTGYSEIFSSEYSMWKEIITDMYVELNDRLGSVWGLTMDSHTYITDDVVRVTYSDGSKVYINYGDKDVTVENVKIPSEDYILTKGANNQ